ncbi:MAG: hypothetical protein J7J61_07285, partial [Candidatus Hydrothermae bacterium]|nr:hypothetical protein [Candidatus Hydrothermae bacterium]
MTQEVLIKSLTYLIKNSGITRRMFWKIVETYAYRSVVKGNAKNRPEEVQKYKYYILKAMYRSVERN